MLRNEWTVILHYVYLILHFLFWTCFWLSLYYWTHAVPECESRIEKPHPVYVPRDEAFEETKQATFSRGRLKAVLHNLVPQIAATLASSDIPFSCFSEIDNLYINGFALKDDEAADKVNNISQMLNMGTKLLKYDIPAVIKSMSSVLLI